MDADKNLKPLEDPIARKKRKMEEALARKRAKDGSDDLTSSASSDLTHSATSGDDTEPAEAPTAQPQAAQTVQAATAGAAATPAQPAATPAASPTQPVTAGAATPARPAATPTQPAATPASATPTAETLPVKCPACGNEAQVPKRFLGQLVKCAGCAAALRLEASGAVLAPAAPPASVADADVPGVPVPVIAGIAGVVLLFLVILAFRSGGEPVDQPPASSPTASPSQVAASPTASASPETPATPAPTTEASPTASPTARPSPAPTATASPSPAASVTPRETPAATPTSTRCQLSAQVHFKSDAGLSQRAPSHAVRVVREPEAVLALLPEHLTAYDAAVQAGLARLRALDPTLPREEYANQASQLQRRLQRDVNEVVRSFRLELRRRTVTEVTTNGQGRFELELDPGEYLLVSDAYYPIGEQRVAFFQAVTLAAGARSLEIVGEPTDPRARLLVEREVLPGDE